MLMVRVAASAIVIVMLAAIVQGLVTADFAAEGAALLELTWGVITLVDIYAAFLVVWLWIAWREADPKRAVLWLLLVAVLGSLAIGAYVARAAFRAATPEELLLGSNRRPAPTSPGPRARP